MKKNNIIKVVLGSILICFLLTWIINAASFQSEFVDQGKMQMGLFDLFSYPLTSLSYFGYISLYIIMVGGFYGILNKIPAYTNLIDSIGNKFKKHGVIFVSIIMVVFALLTSICGLQLGLILFFPLIASIILAMGYDKIVVALTLVGSTMAGMIGTTFAYGNVGILTSFLSGSMTDNIPIKCALLLAAVLILIINTVLYIKKSTAPVKISKVEAIENVDNEPEEVEETVIKSEPKTKKTSTKTSTSKTTKKTTTKTSASKKTTTKKKSSKSNNKAAVLDEEVIVAKPVSKKSYSWPIVVSFAILAIIMILAFIPWNEVFGLDIMTKASDAVKEYKIFGFELFAKLFGTFNPFGNWMITDMLLPMAFILLLLVIIYGVKFDDVVDGFVAGAKKAMVPAIVALLIYTILVITTYHPFQLTIYKVILGKASSLNVVTSSVSALLASVLNVEPAYAFQAVIPYLTSLVKDTETYPIIWVIFQSMYGFAMLFAPTSVVLMGVLSYLEVSYKEWLKAIWKLLVEMFVILLLIFTIIVLL